MKKEKPKVYSYRLYQKQGTVPKKWARKLKVSEASIVRLALDEFDFNRTTQKPRD